MLTEQRNEKIQNTKKYKLKNKTKKNRKSRK